MCFQCELVAATLIENYDTWNIITFQYGENMRENQFSNKIRVMQNVEDFLNRSGTGCNLWKRERNGER